MKLGFGDKRLVGKCEKTVFKGCMSSMKHHLIE